MDCNYIVIILVLLIALGIGIVLFLQNKKSVTVNVITCSNEAITQAVDLSGTVVSLDKQTFYAKVDGIIDSVNVSTGDFVSKGDVLYSYDKDELERQILLSELRLQSAEGSFSDNMQKSGINSYRNGEAKLNLEVLDQ